MTFTRQNIGSSATFTRDGALSATTNTPPFQVFQKSTTNSTYSLGGNWKISTNSNTQELNFLYNTTNVLTLNSTGFAMNNIILPTQADYPSNPSVGTLSNVNNNLYVYN
tara:strand:+ start:9369 stop:9695 length:327 start_codon:yes stop_codon:yes gene_type:complete